MKQTFNNLCTIKLSKHHLQHRLLGQRKKALKLALGRLTSATFCSVLSVQAEGFCICKTHTIPFVQLRNEDDADEGGYLVVRAAGEGVAHAAGERGQIGNSIRERKESD